MRVLGSSLLVKDNIKDLLLPLEEENQYDGQLQFDFEAC